MKNVFPDSGQLAWARDRRGQRFHLVCEFSGGGLATVSLCGHRLAEGTRWGNYLAVGPTP